MHFYATLRARLVLLVLAAVLPVFAFSIGKAVLGTEAAVRSAALELQTDAALLASSQHQVSETARQVLTAVANAPDVQDGNSARCSAYLATLNRLYTDYANLGIIGIDGYARCHGIGHTSPTYLGDRSYFRDAVARRDFVSGEYIFGRLTRTHVFGFALPVLDAQGQVKQVAYVVLDLAAMSASVARARLPPSGRLAVIDRNGTVLAANPPASRGIGSKLRSPVALAAVKTMSVGVQEGLDGSGQPRIFAYQPSSPGADSPFFVVMSIDRNEVVAAAHRQLNLELLLLGLVALLGGAIAWAMGRPMIVKPTQAILQATQRLKDGERDVRIPVRPVDTGSEFSLIAEGFNRMADALAEREAELQTELAKSRATQRKLIDAQRMGRIGHSEFDLVTGQIVLSDEVHELFGLAPGAFDGRIETVLERLHPDDRERYRQTREDAMRTGSDLDLEYRIITPAGELRWIHQIGREQRNDAGMPVSRIGVMQDITARKRSELALAEATDLLRRTGEIANIGGWELVLHDMQPIWSDQVYRIHELGIGSMPSLAEAIGFYAPESRPVISAAVQAGIADGTPWDLELPMVTAAGRQIWARSQGQAVMQEGKVARLVGTLQDITPRKRAEQAMQESEQRYAALFAEAPAPMWVFDDVSYEFKAVNHAAVESYGYSQDEVLAITIFGLHPASDHARLRRQLAGDSPLRKGTWLHRRKDGTMFPVSVVSKLITYGGRPARFVMALDLTAQREAEATVQEHLFTLQRAADAAQAISWHQTLGGMMQEVAEQARGVIGVHQAFVSLSLESAPGESSVALSVSQSREALWRLEELPELRRLFAPVLTNNRSMRLNQSEISELAGNCESLQVPSMRGCLVVPLLGRSGKNIGLLQLSDKYEGAFTQQDEYVAMELARLAALAMENVQLLEEVGKLNEGLEQKVAQRTEALTRQEALFRALAQQAPQVVWTTNPKGEVTFMNRAWFDLVGGVFENWSGIQWFSAIHPEDLPEVKANWKRASTSRAPFVGLRRLIARDGSLRTMSYRASPVFDEKGVVSFWVGIDADITELKAVEAQLRLSNQELEAFSYSVSHDLRSPLNTIDGFSRLLAKQIPADAGPKAGHYLARIHAGVAQMTQLIEDMLSLAQVSRTELRHELIDLSAIAGLCVEALRARDPERQVEVNIHPDLRAWGDARLVRAVMDNLLGNAWKFSSRREDASITVGQTADPVGHVVFFVRDNGAGFDMAYADKLFRAFQRLHTAAEFPGTGIGLATVNRIIARHGGDLWAESAPGAGATFFFTLPKFSVSVQ